MGIRLFFPWSSLGQIFGVSASPVCENLSTTFILPIMYEHYIQRYGHD